MVAANIREGNMRTEDIINIIRNANPSILVGNVSEGRALGHTLDLTTRGSTEEGLNRNVNNLITILRNIHPGITVERRLIVNGSSIVMERVDEGSIVEINTKRSARGIR